MNMMIVIFAIITGLFSAPGPADAADLVFAVDRSAAMGELCVEGDSTLLELAREQIREILTDPRQVSPGDRLALLTFDQDSAVLARTGVPAEILRRSLDKIEISDEPAVLAAGLKGAETLIKEGGRPWEAKIIVFSAGGLDRGREILTELAQLSASGIMVQIKLLDQAGPRLCRQRDRYNSELLQIDQLGCAGAQKTDSVKKQVKSLKDLAVTKTEAKPPAMDAAAPRTSSQPSAGLADLIKQISIETGLESSQLHAGTNLNKDLGLDRQEVFELIATLSERLNFAMPEGEFTTLGDLAAYTAKAPLPGRLLSFTPGVASKSPSRAPSPAAVKAADSGKVYLQEIYYGTNRQATGLEDPDSYFGGDRARGGIISYGTCQVSIPANHRHGATESAFLGLKFLENANKHIVLQRVSPLPKKEFFKRLKARASLDNGTPGDWDDDAVIFIHGFNVKFANAAKRTAQIAYDFGFTGLPLMFSWPSDGKLYAYMSDREDVTWSILHIEAFLDDVLARIGPKRVHLVAHSMGNQGLIGALNLMAARQKHRDGPLFENIILAAPDFDAELFEEQVAANVVGLARSWTIYTSDNDAALNISTKINSAKRLGLPVTPVAGFAVIDATGIEVTPWSVPEFHSYYATKQRVVEDIISAIKGVSPAARNLLPRQLRGVTYWRLAAGP